MEERRRGLEEGGGEEWGGREGWEYVRVEARVTLVGHFPSENRK